MHILRENSLKIKSDFILCLACLCLAVFLAGCATSGSQVKPSPKQEVYTDEFGNEYIIEYAEADEAGDTVDEYMEGEIVILDEPADEPGYSEIKSRADDELPAVVKEGKPFTPPAGSQQHKVWIWQETRDSLWTIAETYYGDPWKWKKIYLANQDIIYDPNIIFPKQILAIPPDE